MSLSYHKRLLHHIWQKSYLYWLHSRQNIIVEGVLTIRGKPLIDIRSTARLEIGNNVTLRSTNVGYHINLYAPVKLFAAGDGAVIKIGENSRINGACIRAQKSVTVGKNCSIAANCQIMDGSGHVLSFPDAENRINTRGAGRAVVIEDNVWVGTGTVVLPGVTIGAGSVISANSVVLKDIPPMVIAGGNPAVVIKHYSNKSMDHMSAGATYIGT